MRAHNEEFKANIIRVQATCDIILTSFRRMGTEGEYYIMSHLYNAVRNKGTVTESIRPGLRLL